MSSRVCLLRIPLAAVLSITVLLLLLFTKINRQGGLSRVRSSAVLIGKSAS